MGVPKFFKWLSSKSEFKNVILPGNISSLNIDINAELHRAAAESYGYSQNLTSEEQIKKIDDNKKKNITQLEEQFIEKFIQNLNETINKAGATDILYLAVDGIPPFAKIIQQRNRRFLTFWTRKFEIPFDSNAISPGTRLMEKIDVRIRKWIKETGNLPNKVMYSGADIPGEGEHKIMNAFREETYYDINKNHVVLGMDTDLFMLTLVSPINNIYLWRPQVGEKLQVISINQAKLQIASMMNVDVRVAPKDFVLITSLLGNDFIPRHPSLENFQFSIDKLLELYRSSAKHFIKNTIDWEKFRPFLKQLAIIEPDLLVYNREHYEYPIPFVTLSESIINHKFSYNTFKNLWYKKVQTNEEEMLNKYNGIEDMCISYMETIEFVLEYYVTGNISNEYHYKYHYPPLLVDLYNISVSKSTQVSTEKRWIRLPKEIPLKVEYLHAIIFPLQSKALMHDMISFQLENNISNYPEIWADYWPKYEPIVDAEGHGQLHTGIVIIPFPPIDLVKKLNLPLGYLPNIPTSTPLIIDTTLKSIKKIQRKTKTPKKPTEEQPADNTEISVFTNQTDALPDIGGLVDIMILNEHDTENTQVEQYKSAYVDPIYL